MRKSVIRATIAVSPYQVLMSAPTRRSQTLHALTADALGPKFGKCRDCHGFDRAVTKTGIAVCANPVHAEEKPPLPKREPGATNPPKPRAGVRTLSVLAR